jgi:hypothetical protein
MDKKIFSHTHTHTICVCILAHLTAAEAGEADYRAEIVI